MFRHGCRSGDACSMSSAFAAHVKAVSCRPKTDLSPLPSNRRRRLWLCNCIIKGYRCRWVAGSKVNLAMITAIRPGPNCRLLFYRKLLWWIHFGHDWINCDSNSRTGTDRAFLESLKVHKVGKYLRIKLWLRWKFFDMTFEHISCCELPIHVWVGREVLLLWGLRAEKK